MNVLERFKSLWQSAKIDELKQELRLRDDELVRVNRSYNETLADNNRLRKEITEERRLRADIANGLSGLNGLLDRFESQQ